MLAERMGVRRVQLLWTTFIDRNRTNREARASQKGCDLFTQIAIQTQSWKQGLIIERILQEIKQVWSNIKKWSHSLWNGLQFWNLIEEDWSIDPSLPLCHGIICRHSQSHFSQSPWLSEKYSSPVHYFGLSHVSWTDGANGLLVGLTWVEATTVWHSWPWSLVLLPFPCNVMPQVAAGSRTNPLRRPEPDP